jgi:hypothetical protein
MLMNSMADGTMPVVDGAVFITCGKKVRGEKQEAMGKMSKEEE